MPLSTWVGGRLLVCRLSSRGDHMPLPHEGAPEPGRHPTPEETSGLPKGYREGIVTAITFLLGFALAPRARSFIGPAADLHSVRRTLELLRSGRRGTPDAVLPRYQ